MKSNRGRAIAWRCGATRVERHFRFALVRCASTERARWIRPEPAPGGLLRRRGRASGGSARRRRTAAARSAKPAAAVAAGACGANRELARHARPTEEGGTFAAPTSRRPYGAPAHRHRPAPPRRQRRTAAEKHEGSEGERSCTDSTAEVPCASGGNVRRRAYACSDAPLPPARPRSGRMRRNLRRLRTTRTVAIATTNPSAGLLEPALASCPRRPLA
jgi:hypothetical protein